MRVRGLLLTVFAGFAIVHVVGTLFTSPLLPLAPVLAWSCLLAYAVLAGAEAPPAVRWPVLAGLLVLDAGAAADWWASAGPGDGGHTYQILVAAPADFDLWGARLRQVAPLLVACGLLAGAVLAGSAGRRASGGVRSALWSLTLVGLVLAAGFAAMQLWALPYQLTRYGWELAAGVAAAFAVAAAAILAAAAAAARAGAATTPTGAAGLAAAGLCLLALVALSVLADLVAAVPRPFSYRIDEPGVLVEMHSVAVAGNPFRAGWSVTTAATVVVQFAAVAAVTAGWLRAVARPRS